MKVMKLSLSTFNERCFTFTFIQWRAVFGFIRRDSFPSTPNPFENPTYFQQWNSIYMKTFPMSYYHLYVSIDLYFFLWMFEFYISFSKLSELSNFLNWISKTIFKYLYFLFHYFSPFLRLFHFRSFLGEKCIL